MRPRRLDLSALLKQGISPESGTHLGWSLLKNIKTDGTILKACPDETTTVVPSGSLPFTMDKVDYILVGTTIRRASSPSLVIYTLTFTPTRLLNMTKVVWLQDSTHTAIFDYLGIHYVNPTGFDIPDSNSACLINGQIIVGGLTNDYNQLDNTYIGWSDIGLDCFNLDKQNVSGFYNPRIGIVRLVLPLQDSIIVLGSAGACQMYYAGHTFGFRDLDIPLLGTAGLGASSTNSCLYIAKDGSIISVDKNGAYTNLKYCWIGNDTVDLKYLNGRNWFCFTTASISYLLDQSGMFSFGHIIYGEFESSLAVPSTFEQDSYGFSTFYFTPNRTGMTTLFEITVEDNLETTNTVSVEIYSKPSLSSQGPRVLNHLRSIKYPIAGSAFSLRYTSTSPPTITDLAIEVDKLDRRFGYGSQYEDRRPTSAY